MNFISACIAMIGLKIGRSKRTLSSPQQGGPGCASLFGNFFELGPQVLNDEGVLTDNAFAWNRRYGLLFIDQPVGTSSACVIFLKGL